MRIDDLHDRGCRALVAYFDRRDRHHRWASGHLDALLTPPVTCEAVVNETCFLLRRNLPGAERNLIESLSRGRVLIAFDLGNEAATIAALMERYSNVPMSLADACLVRMAEIIPNSRILSLDGDFRIYRKNGRDNLDTVLPEVGT